MNTPSDTTVSDKDTDLKSAPRQYRSIVPLALRRYRGMNTIVAGLKIKLDRLQKNTAEWMNQEELAEERRIMGLEIKNGFESRKKACEKDLIAAVKAQNGKAFAWLKEQDGLGQLTAALYAATVDIEKADTVSSLWRYFGLCVTPTGERQRPTKGQTLDYVPWLKSSALMIGQNTLLTKRYPKWRALYDAYKAETLQLHPDWTKGHVHNAARRRMVKRWLRDLWLGWRRLEGLSVKGPSIIARDTDKGSETASAFTDSIERKYHIERKPAPCGPHINIPEKNNMLETAAAPRRKRKVA